MVYTPQISSGSSNAKAPEAQITYAGHAPDLVAGAVQVNFTVPLNAPTGGSVLIHLTDRQVTKSSWAGAGGKYRGGVSGAGGSSYCAAGAVSGSVFPRWQV